MLMESSFSSSVETSILKVPEYQDSFTTYDWVSFDGTFQMNNKFPEQSQISFIEAVPVPDALNIDESTYPKSQVSCPEKSVMHKVSEKSLTSLVYSRRERSVRPEGTAEHNPSKNKKQDDSTDHSNVPVHDRGESTRRNNRFNNCLVYIRKKRRGDSNSNFTGEPAIKSDEVDDAFVFEHDCGKTKKRLDNCLVYSRKKARVEFNSCRFSKHVSGETNLSGDQNDSSTYSQSKQLVKSNGGSPESYIGETKRNGNRSDFFLMYSRRKQRGKSVGARVNGSLVYSRKKHKVKSRHTFTGHDPRETKKVLMLSSHALSWPEKYADSISHVEQARSALELASGSSKTGKNEATNCDSTDAEASEKDTDGRSSSFRQCKRCDKPGTGEKMLICDECEAAYHTRCCGVRMKEVADIDDWLCPSCLKKMSKIKGEKARELRKWRVTEPFAIGIRIGKEFQADVRDWSGPIMSDTCFVGEPLEIDQSEYTHDLKKAKNGKKPQYIVNWLQCRKEDSNGDICGKWRRAPRSEIQTNDWECFCCVFWDPSRADCAVPQELETIEILKQLKCIKMLRPHSDTKRRKTGPKEIT